MPEKKSYHRNGQRSQSNKPRKPRFRGSRRGPFSPQALPQVAEHRNTHRHNIATEIEKNGGKCSELHYRNKCRPCLGVLLTDKAEDLSGNGKMRGAADREEFGQALQDSQKIASSKFTWFPSCVRLSKNRQQHAGCYAYPDHELLEVFGHDPAPIRRRGGPDLPRFCLPSSL